MRSKSRRPRALGLLVAVVAALVTGCASHPQSVAGDLSAAAVPPDAPAINWTMPIPDGTAVRDVSAAVSVGHLSFSPETPPFDSHPMTIEVSDSAFDTVAFVYQFPLGSDFPTDGHVRVLESKARISQTDLLAVASNPPGPAADFAVIQIGSQSALLVQDAGVGRVQFIRNGIEFDVTGPATSPAEAEKLAALL